MSAQCGASKHVDLGRNSTLSRPEGRMARPIMVSSNGQQQRRQLLCFIYSKVSCASRFDASRARFAAIVAQSVVASGTTALLGRELSAEEATLWQSSCNTLAEALGASSEEAARLLARGFGWSSQAYWRQDKVQELPQPHQVAAVLSFLRCELPGVTGEEVGVVVRGCPELLACEVEGRLRENLGVLRTQWRLQGPTLTKAVVRQPRVLGYSVDCGGDCVGECNRCWARF
ncbi:hypothetical protein Agub_g5899 [Astrephomene gubernaculifera]|uniref:Uncharacterized protein n=1 Tax=Astrephomene gubernaculifera TaxID=47775 RepID=A0AAD3HKF6_9CHLO|nr:hypothetical protein Agub_g5899 [Astrephomene gubernaculifera]